MKFFMDLMKIKHDNFSLDLSAAFDRFDINKIFDIVDEQIGVGGVVLKWFRSFLEDRMQKVKIDNQYSEKFKCSMWCSPRICPGSQNI